MPSHPKFHSHTEIGSSIWNTVKWNGDSWLEKCNRNGVSRLAQKNGIRNMVFVLRVCKREFVTSTVWYISLRLHAMCTDKEHFVLAYTHLKIHAAWYFFHANVFDYTVNMHGATRFSKLEDSSEKWKWMPYENASDKMRVLDEALGNWTTRFGW